MASAPDPTDHLAHAARLREQGFTTLPGLLPLERIEPVARALRELWREHGEPALYARDDVHFDDGIEVTPVGFTVTELLSRIPDATRLLLQPEVLAVFRELLGEGFELEMVSGILSDHTRPFFFWHNHVGGIDGEDYRRKPLPTFSRTERLGCTFYLSPLDDEHGVMLVHPRAVTDPAEPPCDPGTQRWPGAVELRMPAGSVLVVDQGTWHAVTPMCRPGQRAFVGSFVRRADLPPTVRRDASVQQALACDPDLAHAYGGATLG